MWVIAIRSRVFRFAAKSPELDWDTLFGGWRMDDQRIRKQLARACH